MYVRAYVYTYVCTPLEIEPLALVVIIMFMDGPWKDSIATDYVLIIYVVHLCRYNCTSKIIV